MPEAIRRKKTIRIMNKYYNSRNGFIHLYNPKEEGLGHYDVHYINAHKKKKEIKRKARNEQSERNVA